jgi:hypothetical protein
MLDPDAYTYAIGSGWSMTVPTDEEYILISAWQARLGSTGPTLMHRDPRTRMRMASGFNLQSNGHASAHAYYIDPTAVSYADPKAKYFERLARMKDLMQYAIGVTVASGQAQGTLGSATFPTDFTNGLLLGCQAFDVAWVCLGAGGSNILNLDSEISDDHSLRFAGGFGDDPIPFVRATFVGIVARGANLAGTATTTIAGNASGIYMKLPSDW